MQNLHIKQRSLPEISHQKQNKDLLLGKNQSVISSIDLNKDITPNFNTQYIYSNSQQPPKPPNVNDQLGIKKRKVRLKISPKIQTNPQTNNINKQLKIIKLTQNQSRQFSLTNKKTETGTPKLMKILNISKHLQSPMNQSTGRLSSVDGKISKNKISFDEYSKMFKEMQAGKIKKPVLYEKAENMLKSMKKNGITFYHLFAFYLIGKKLIPKKSNRSTISRKQQEESDRKRSMKITSISDYQNEESITNRKLKSKRSSKSLDSQKSKKDNEQPKETALCECCLQRKSDFIILDCKHYICLRCINDLKIMTGIYNEEQINTIQCIVCDSTQEIDTLELLTKQDSLSMSQIIKSRSLSKRKSSQKLSQIIEKGQPKKTKVEKAKLVLDQLFKIQRSMMKCQMCPTKALQMQKEAEYECLNCNFVMCQDCRTKHKNHARFKNHAIIVYVDLETHQQKVENDRCIFHKELLKLFCVTCNYPLCMLCVEFEDDHKNHELRTLSKMLEDVNRNKDNRKREINEKLLPQVQSYIQSYKEFKFKLEQQRDGSLQEIGDKFEQIYDNLMQR